MTRTMASVDHADRGDPRNVFSEMFRRGSTTASDGGKTQKEKREERAAMKDVDHEAPDDADAAGVWKRGVEDDEE